MIDEEEYILVWEAPEIVKPEFRLYYDDKGRVLFYTCEKPEGNFIVIDALTYAEARPDVRVVDGRVVHITQCRLVSKVKPSTDGVLCEREDLSIVTTDKDGQCWKLITHEL